MLSSSIDSEGDLLVSLNVARPQPRFASLLRLLQFGETWGQWSPTEYAVAGAAYKALDSLNHADIANQWTQLPDARTRAIDLRRGSTEDVLVSYFSSPRGRLDRLYINVKAANWMSGEYLLELRRIAHQLAIELGCIVGDIDRGRPSMNRMLGPKPGIQREIAWCTFFGDPVIDWIGGDKITNAPWAEVQDERPRLITGYLGSSPYESEATIGGRRAADVEQVLGEQWLSGGQLDAKIASWSRAESPGKP